LAWRIKPLQAERAVNYIQDTGEAVTGDNTFKSFYEQLYVSEYPPETDAQANLLDQSFPIFHMNLRIFLMLS
jgi:hypothetical protein